MANQREEGRMVSPARITIFLDEGGNLAVDLYAAPSHPGGVVTWDASPPLTRFEIVFKDDEGGGDDRIRAQYHVGGSPFPAGPLVGQAPNPKVTRRVRTDVDLGIYSYGIRATDEDGEEYSLDPEVEVGPPPWP